MKMIENSLIRQILNGATERYAELVRLHQNSVFAMIVRIVGNAEEAEELTQDVFLKAYDNLSRFNQKSSLSTWLFRIAYNTAISHSRIRRPNTLPIDEKRIASITDEELEQYERDSQEADVERLMKAIEQLPSDERALITMFYYKDLSIAECGQITSQSEANVKVKLHRIRKKLYIMIKSSDDGEE